MKKLRLVHIPQVGTGVQMVLEVDNVDEAIKIADVLAYYDLMQYEERIKGDYSNITFLEEYCEEEEEWIEYYDEEFNDFSTIRVGKGYTLISDKKEWELKRKENV